MNKILNFNVQNHIQTLKSGGGQINYKTPLNFDNYDKFLNDLKAIFKSIRSKTKKTEYILYHKDGIPAISNRLNDAMKTIFENNKLTYISNVIDNNRLGFFYSFSYHEIENAIIRMEEIKEKINQILQKTKLTINEFFDLIKEKKGPENELILDLVEIKFKDISHVSKTSLTRLLSLINYQYDEIIENKPKSTDKDKKNSIIDFCSNERRKDAENKLLNLGIKFTKISDAVLDINNNKREIELEGVVQVHSYDTFYSNQISNNDEFSLDDVLYKKYNEQIQKNGINVGVIDGGIGSGKIKDYLNYYPITNYFNYSEEKIPKGDHAENVCSMLLFANQLDSNKLFDNCRTPNVHLFDICFDNITAGELMNLIEFIVEQHHKKIKIWNLSLSLGNTTSNKIIWSEGISSFGRKLDEIQKKYNVLFIVASGNKDESEDNELITSPSDSMMAISVASANLDGSKTDYSLSGNYKDNKFYANKPDISVKAIDDKGNFPFLSYGLKKIGCGTSYATPLITRKVAELLSDGIDLFAIPAILNAIAIFYNRKNSDNDELLIDDYLGYGCIPNNIDLIRNMSNENCMIVSKIKVKDYNQGFFSLKLPKTKDNKFDLNIILSSNINANFSNVPSFEYVEDTVRMQFGAVDPFNDQLNKLHTNWKLDEIRGDSDNAGIKEIDLRRLYNKYKNRYCSIKFLKRNKQSYIMKNSEQRDIETWGMTFTRNDIRSKREDELDVYFCLIFSSINSNEIFNYIHNENQIYLNNILEIDDNDYDDIYFN